MTCYVNMFVQYNYNSVKMRFIQILFLSIGVQLLSVNPNRTFHIHSWGKYNGTSVCV